MINFPTQSNITGLNAVKIRATALVINNLGLARHISLKNLGMLFRASKENVFSFFLSFKDLGICGGTGQLYCKGSGCMEMVVFYFTFTKAECVNQNKNYTSNLSTLKIVIYKA